MKYFFNHKIIGIAMMCATVMACTDKYDLQPSSRKA